ncbi:MAG: hypothetical protein V1838_05865 [Patescibacteria group bacterium]
MLVALIVYFSITLSSSGLSFNDYFCSATGFCPYFGKWSGPFIDSNWFISLIVVLYLLFPVLLKLFNKNKHITIVVLLFISVIARLYFLNSPVVPRYELEWFPLCRIFEFGLGIYLAFVIKQNFWWILDGQKQFASILGFIALLSFPLFLVHHPLLPVLTGLYRSGAGLLVSITVYLAVSVLVSWLVLKLSEFIKKGFSKTS